MPKTKKTLKTRSKIPRTSSMEGTYSTEVKPGSVLCRIEDLDLPHEDKRAIYKKFFLAPPGGLSLPTFMGSLCYLKRGEVVGFISVSEAEDSSDETIRHEAARIGGSVQCINYLFVAPGHRRRGYGRALLMHVLRRAEERDGIVVFIADSEPFAPCDKIFASCGMKHIGSVFYYGSIYPLALNA